MKLYPSLFYRNIAVGYFVALWTFGLATYSRAEQKAEAATSSTSQRPGGESKPGENGALSSFTLSYSSGSSVNGSFHSITGNIQPDGKLALKIEDFIYNERGKSLKNDWVAVASPELKDCLLVFVNKHLQLRHENLQLRSEHLILRWTENETIHKEVSPQNSENSLDQPKEEDIAKRHERIKADSEKEIVRSERIKAEMKEWQRLDDESKSAREMEEKSETGGSQSRLSISYIKGVPRTTRIPVDENSTFNLFREVYAATRSKAGQEKDKQQRLAWEQEGKRMEEDRRLERIKEEMRLERIRYENKMENQRLERIKEEQDIAQKPKN